MDEQEFKEPKPSICDSCGEEFGCGAKLDGCWCADVKVSEETSERLKNTFKGCLCPDCLEKYEASGEAPRQ